MRNAPVSVQPPLRRLRVPLARGRFSTGEGHLNPNAIGKPSQGSPNAPKIDLLFQNCYVILSRPVRESRRCIQTTVA
ncbi:MAG: hypothetical protein MAG451_00592 [Anaerolineales bacterium]|nr:hypothetical protein [Anaerolineales bacterium]